MLILPSFAARTHYAAYIEIMLARIFLQKQFQANELMTDNGIKCSSSTPYEQWQNGRAEVQIRVLLNIVSTNMTASGLRGKFWARAILYAAEPACLICARGSRCWSSQTLQARQQSQRS